MPYIQRSASGRIEAVFEQPQDGATEEVTGENPEVMAFLFGEEQTRWVQSDLAMARVLEDLINVLLEKHVILFSDLPHAAQEKLISRRGFRKELDYLASLIPESEDFIDM